MLVPSDFQEPFDERWQRVTSKCGRHWTHPLVASSSADYLHVDSFRTLTAFFHIETNAGPGAELTADYVARMNKHVTVRKAPALGFVVKPHFTASLSVRWRLFRLMAR